jgi:hypothetical protein
MMILQCRMKSCARRGLRLVRRGFLRIPPHRLGGGRRVHDALA